MKRVFSFLLVLLLVVGLVPVQAQAATNTVTVHWIDANDPDYFDMTSITGNVGDRVQVIAPSGKVITSIATGGDTAGSLQVEQENDIWYVWIPDTPNPEIGGEVADAYNNEDGSRKYNVSVSPYIENGTVTVSTSEAAQGDPVTVKAEPQDSTYRAGAITVTPADPSKTVTVAGNTFTMPDCDVTVAATFVPKTLHAITTKVEPENSGTVTTDVSSAIEGQEITITATVTDADAYVFDSVMVKDADGKEVSVTDQKFVMPDSAVTVTAKFAPLYGVDIIPAEHGMVTAAPMRAKAGEKITVTDTPDNGYALKKITVTDSSNNVLTANSDGTYTMPADGMKITAEFVTAIKITFNHHNEENAVNSFDIAVCTGLNTFPKSSNGDLYFSGWFTDKDGGSRVEPNTIFEKSTDLHAHWIEVDHITIRVNNVLTAGINMTKSEILDMLVTPVDIAKDQNIYVYLKGDDAPAADISAINGSTLASGKKMLTYADLTLYKQIGDETQQLSENFGGTLSIVLSLADVKDLPDNITQENLTVLHYHKGNVKPVAGVQYIAATKELTFETNEFSTYAVAYTPTARTTTNTYVLDNVPKTGEGSALMGWTLLVLCSTAMLVAVTVFDKKRAR